MLNIQVYSKDVRADLVARSVKSLPCHSVLVFYYLHSAIDGVEVYGPILILTPSTITYILRRRRYLCSKDLIVLLE